MSWFGSQSKKRSPNAKITVGSNSAGPPSAAEDRPTSWLEGDGQGLHNPLAWDSVPSALREKFPHWKESPASHQRSSSQPSTQEPEQGYSCYKTTYNIKQQPDYTFPYVVMEHDTLNSIAIKFDTTPAELARLNKKPTSTSTIFTGEVLYIPDQDERARSAPKSAPPQIRSSSDQLLTSSAESEGTIRSSSVSQPLPDSDPAVLPQEREEEEEEGGEEDGAPLLPYNKDGEFFEEVTENHMVLVSRYISDDQGCAHGNLMINQTAMMFTPFPTEPLVKEHGSAHFEVMIPIQDITFAAFTKDVNPPESKKSRKGATEETDSATSLQQRTEETQKGGEGDRVVNGKEEGEDSEEEKGEENEVEKEGGEKKVAEGAEGKKEAENGEEDEAKEGVDEEAGSHEQVRTEGDVEVEPLKSSGSEAEFKSPGRASNSDSQLSSDSQVDGVLGARRQGSSTEEMLAIMGVDGVQQRKLSSHISVESSSSADSLLSEHPCFLHIRVSHKCSAAHTYTPLNRAVGIDIPHDNTSSVAKGTVQQVKTVFCFAVAERRMSELVFFICKHYPRNGCGEVHTSLSFPITNWTEGSYEFVSQEDFATHEDLNFSDNYFQGAESSESWEVYSLKDVPKLRRKIDRMEVEPGLPLPVLSEASSLMTEAHLRALANNILSAAVGHDWFLVYSTFKHGISLRTLYRNMVTCDLPESPVVLLVRDEHHKLFGAAVTSPLKLSEKFYGTGESYLFSFESPTDIRVFPWTGENNYIVKGSTDSICVGCEDGHSGLWLDESLLSGSSEECSTFGNTCLSTQPEFTCTGLEAWGFA